MVNQILDNFNQRMNGLKPDKRRRFLHGVYKQLTESHRGRQADGEYKDAIRQYHPESEDRTEFVVNVADALNRYSLENQAKRLLEQERKTEAYDRWRHTLSELEKISPELKEGLELYLFLDGVELDIGGYRQGEPFSASVVLHGISYGRDSNLYEVCPVFGNSTLRGEGYNDNVLGWLSLEDALSIAQATVSQDRQRYDLVLQRAKAA